MRRGEIPEGAITSLDELDRVYPKLNRRDRKIAEYAIETIGYFHVIEAKPRGCMDVPNFIAKLQRAYDATRASKGGRPYKGDTQTHIREAA